MKAIVVTPGMAGSARMVDMPTPSPGPEEVLVKVLEIGVDRIDRHLAEGVHGQAPPGEDVLIIGHSSLGQVTAVGPAARGLKVGDLVVATVRRPDGCPSCAAGEPDMCQWGAYKERGIRGQHGFMAEWFVDRPEFLVKVPRELGSLALLAYPLAVAEKAIGQSIYVQGRLRSAPRRAVVFGAGLTGLAATLLLRLQGMEVWTVERVRDSERAEMAERIGARYVALSEETISSLINRIGPADLVVEASGNPEVFSSTLRFLGRNGLLCMMGLPHEGLSEMLDVADVGRRLVTHNQVILGSVSANRRHFEQALRSLGRIREQWPGVLEALVALRMSFAEGWRDALAPVQGRLLMVLEVSHP
jgi:threonine dehydrogenase-like Zn-dependent dehydrogenase